MPGRLVLLTASQGLQDAGTGACQGGGPPRLDLRDMGD